MSSTGKRIGDDIIIKKFFENYDYHSDSFYVIWEQQLYDEDNKFTFEKTLEFCKIDWKFSDPNWKEHSKKKWLAFIQEWNAIRYERETIENSIVGYAAITYLFIVLPYHQIERKSERCEHITEFQAKAINICMLHETGKNLVCFKDYDMLTIDDPPHDPDEYEQFLHDQYNSASWFLTFLLYAKGARLGHKGVLWT